MSDNGVRKTESESSWDVLLSSTSPENRHLNVLSNAGSIVLVITSRDSRRLTDEDARSLAAEWIVQIQHSELRARDAPTATSSAAPSPDNADSSVSSSDAELTDDLVAPTGLEACVVTKETDRTRQARAKCSVWKGNGAKRGHSICNRSKSDAPDRSRLLLLERRAHPPRTRGGV